VGLTLAYFGRDPRSSDRLRRIVFQKTQKKLFTKFPVFETSGCHNSAKITDNRKFTANSLSTGCLVSILLLELIQSLFSGLYVPYKKVPSQIFGNVRCLILRVKTNSTPQNWCGLASDILKKSRLNWKLRITNTADNAGITQSQARDTR